MFPCTYTIGRPRRRASPGVRTNGRDTITSGMSRPLGDLPMLVTQTSLLPVLSESMNAITSACDDVAVKFDASGRVCGWRRERSRGGYAPCGDGVLRPVPALAHAATAI